jgi:hypothetical protein
MVAMPLKAKSLCTMERAKIAVGVAYISAIIVCIPVYLTFSIKETIVIISPSSSSSKPNNNNNTNNVTRRVTRYIVHYSELAKSHGRALITANFWTYR